MCGFESALDECVTISRTVLICLMSQKIVQQLILESKLVLFVSTAFSMVQQWPCNVLT